MLTAQGAMAGTGLGEGGREMFMGSGAAREMDVDGLKGAADADSFLLASP